MSRMSFLAKGHTNVTNMFQKLFLFRFTKRVKHPFGFKAEHFWAKHDVLNKKEGVLMKNIQKRKVGTKFACNSKRGFNEKDFS